jgi:hypothetical protein
MIRDVLTRNGRLREICKNIELIFPNLIPLGMKRLLANSILSNANCKRDHTVFELLYSKLYR